MPKEAVAKVKNAVRGRSAEVMHQLLRSILRALGGYPGIFMVSVIGNLIPFIPIPYLAAVYFYSMRMPDANPILVGLVSGVGGAIGKMASYLTGRGARAFLSKETAERYERIGKLLSNYGALAAFLISATPSPDDVIVMPLGLMKYDALKVFAGLVAGKVVISTATALAGCAVAHVSRYELLLEAVLSVVLFALVIVLLVYLDWEKILVDLATKGVRGFVAELRRNGLSPYIYRRKLPKLLRGER